MPASRLPNDWSRTSDPTAELQAVLDDYADRLDGGTVTIRKNSGANVGTRPRINLIEGANVTITVADDGVGDEVAITIAASGGGGGSGNSYNPSGW